MVSPLKLGGAGALAGALLLSACTSAPGFLPDVPPRWESFQVCSGYSCTLQRPVALTASEWRQIRDMMLPRARNAAEERERLARVIGRFEQLVGPRTGTAGDLAGSAQGAGGDLSGQMDCIDESRNTTTYLALLEQQGLLVHHRLQPTARRYSLLGYPHNTAVIRAIAEGRDYAVDSWFFGNGHDAQIVPLSVWRRGWSP